MVLVEEDTVVVHTSGVTSTARMLPVLSDTSMAGADVAALLSVLFETGSHGSALSHSAAVGLGFAGYIAVLRSKFLVLLMN